MLDEPLVGLDPRSAYVMKELLREHGRQGGSVFFSTHIFDVAERLCDRMGIIHRGRLVASGSMDEMRALFAGGHQTLEQIFLGGGLWLPGPFGAGLRRGGGARPVGRSRPVHRRSGVLGCGGLIWLLLPIVPLALVTAVGMAVGRGTALIRHRDALYIGGSLVGLAVALGYQHLNLQLAGRLDFAAIISSTFR